MTLYDGRGQKVNIDGTVKFSSDEFSLYGNNPTPNNMIVNELQNVYKYPLRATWGNEYLNGWYKKLFFGQAVTIAVDGDSTTQEAYLYMNRGRKSQIIEKIMTLGKYPSDLLTVNKNGYGSKASGDYVGSYYSSVIMGTGGEPNAESHPNGLLANTMAQNPDLIIFGYGLNDFNRYATATSANGNISMTIQERLDLFKSNIEEFLQRLRGDVASTINNRECYGKDEYDTAVILCVPIVATNHDKWHYYCRKMIQELCRKYRCGFFDPTIVNYDHLWNSNWSRSPFGTAGDGLHPNPWTNADFVSAIQPLLFPIGLWFGDNEKVYTVTYNLTNCEVSNKPLTMREGTKLETIITANEGYTMEGVTITMGENNPYNPYDSNSGEIQVSDINGNIVITATATEITTTE